MKEVILDTETTGLNIRDGHRIVEIGCVEVENLIPTKEKFHCFLNPERKVSDKALEVHGYTDKFLSDKKKFKEIADEFLNFINGKRLVIHNAEFDLSHINNELKIMGKAPLKNDVIDTLILARNKFPGSSSSLDALCKRYRIDNSKREQHSALIDCDLLVKVYINLTDQKEPALDFKKNIDLKEKTLKENILYSKKVIKPSQKELESHQHYIKTSLKKNYY
ncbi:DNA polymerase III subunit epsilon [Candidatus Pelagibacter sp.]|nr:DNA polymerase III subunit epsilon [Candidatus Pelagibacter sp.]